MANPDRPVGFQPVKTLFGSPWHGLVRRVQAADSSSDTSNNHGDIYIGDPIKYSSGKALPANSGDTVLGVCVGVGRVSGEPQNESGPFDPDNLRDTFSDHTKTDTDTIFIYYVPAEGMIFEVQSESDLDLALGAEADFSTDANESHGSRTTSLSSAELVADSNSDVVVVEIPEYPDNDSTLANTRYHVRFRDTQHLAADPAS